MRERENRRFLRWVRAPKWMPLASCPRPVLIPSYRGLLDQVCGASLDRGHPIGMEV